jgi:predicted O-methyltransferase YrrM
MSFIIEPKQLEYLKQFLKNNDPFLLELENYAKLNRIPIIDKFGAEFLKLFLMIKKPKKILEIGTAIGYSTIIIAQNTSNDAKIITLEKSKNNIPLAQENFKKSNTSTKIQLIEGDAIDSLDIIAETFDFIFLDADKEDYLTIFKKSIGKLNKDGIIFIDNLLWHGNVALKRITKKMKKSTLRVKEFNEYFMSNNEIIPNIYTIGDGIGIGIKK